MKSNQLVMMLVGLMAGVVVGTLVAYAIGLENYAVIVASGAGGVGAMAGLNAARNARNTTRR